LDLAFLADPLEGDHARLRDGGGLLDVRLAGFRIIVLPWVQTYVLCKAAVITRDLAEHFIARFELRVAPAHGFHRPATSDPRIL
jgi:hypothetical protein